MARNFNYGTVYQKTSHSVRTQRQKMKEDRKQLLKEAQKNRHRLEYERAETSHRTSYVKFAEREYSLNRNALNRSSQLDSRYQIRQEKATLQTANQTYKAAQKDLEKNLEHQQRLNLKIKETRKEEKQLRGIEKNKPQGIDAFFLEDIPNFFKKEIPQAS